MINSTKERRKSWIKIEIQRRFLLNPQAGGGRRNRIVFQWTPNRYDNTMEIAGLYTDHIPF